MSTAPDIPPLVDETTEPLSAKARGFWGEAWLRFRRRKLAMMALVFVCLMSLVAIFAPAIVGTKPLMCKYKGSIYFPALGYYVSDWENAFLKKEVRSVYPQTLKTKDPESCDPRRCKNSEGRRCMRSRSLPQ